MYKQKIGISVSANYSIPTPEVVKMFKKIGFDAISPEWREEEALTAIIETARECGLIVESLHAPYRKVAAMWSYDESISNPAKMELLGVLEDCKKWNVPIMVVHSWVGFEYEFDASRLNFQNFDEVITCAEKYGITVAFENVEGEEYLFALMEHYKENSTVGFCWDSGHEMCFNRSQDLLAKYGDRLVMTHLNDNLGISSFEGKLIWTDDVHMLPYDGIADWDDNIKRLKKSRPMEFLNLEISSNPGSMGLELYFKEAYKRACKIAYRYAKEQ